MTSEPATRKRSYSEADGTSGIDLALEGLKDCIVQGLVDVSGAHDPETVSYLGSPYPLSCVSIAITLVLRAKIVIVHIGQKIPGRHRQSKNTVEQTDH